MGYEYFLFICKGSTRNIPTLTRTKIELMYSKTHTSLQVFSLNVIHVKVSTPMYVYLRQGAQSGEDWGRQRGQFVAAKYKDPVGRR